MLSPGTKLGPYEIVAPIGAGAMGEVYRGRDTRLDRAVAIKVLPDTFASDPDRLHRFTQEARAAGQLQHPNILSVFDIGTHDGVPYEVTELLEGETLREAIGTGPMRARRVTEIAIQIARGLAAAHEHGIVHRDLKPENLFQTKDGRVVVLDFGLAKLTRQEGGGADSLAGTMTAAGVILGTAGYIAPEQVRGEATDHRVDLFALGAILYEMLSGKRAFHGESPVDTLHAILRTDPPDFAAAGVSVPPALERIVRRCLEKRPEQRYQSARDLAFQLEATLEPSTQSGSMAALPARRTWRREWIAGAAAAVLLAAAGFVLVPRLGPRGGVQRPMRLVLIAPSGTTLDVNECPMISPDGDEVAFVANDSAGVSSIWVRRFDASSAERLAGTEGAIQPFWSPDGKFIGFFADAKLKKVRRTGGQIEVLCSDAHGRGGSWNRRGDIVFARGAQGSLYRIAASGGEPVPVTALDSTRGEQAHRFPQFLPDGEHFLFMILATSEDYTVAVGSLRGGEVERITTSRTGAVYAPSGYLFVTRSGQILAQRFDAGRRRLLGEPMPLGDSPEVSNTAASPRLSVANSGELVHVAATPALAELYRMHIERNDRTHLPLPAARYLALAPSPDGGRIAFVRRAGDGGDDLWVADLGSNVTTRLTKDGKAGGSMIWSPDGQRIAYEYLESTSFDLFVQPAAGGTPEPLYRSPVRFKHVSDWSRDGRWIVFYVIEQATNQDIWIIDMEDGRRPAAFRRTPSNEGGGRLSPDGKWLAYDSDESGRSEVYIESFPKPGQRIQVSSRSGFAPQWIHGGRRLVYIGADLQTAYGADISFTPALRASAPRVLRELDRGTVTASYTNDEGSFIAASSLAQSNPPSMSVILNWEKLLAARH